MEIQTGASFKERTQGDWRVIDLPERLDSGRYRDFASQLEGILQNGHPLVALDLTQTRFLCLPALKSILSVASRLRQNEGMLVVVSASEKLKRQFDVYGTPKDLLFVRSFSGLGDFRDRKLFLV